MPEDNFAAECFKSADECLQRAESTESEANRASWLNFAEEWLRLGQQIEQPGKY
jgi:hypothetical protein